MKKLCFRCESSMWAKKGGGLPDLSIEIVDSSKCEKCIRVIEENMYFKEVEQPRIHLEFIQMMKDIDRPQEWKNNLVSKIFTEN